MSKRRSNKDVKVAPPSAQDTSPDDVETSQDDVSTDANADGQADTQADAQADAQAATQVDEQADASQEEEALESAQALAEAHISVESANAQAQAQAQSQDDAQDAEAADAASEQQAAASDEAADDTANETAADDTADEAADEATDAKEDDTPDDPSEPVASSVEHADEPAIELPPAISDEELALQVEVALMTTDRAMPVAKLSDILGKVGAKAINQAVATLNETYESTGRSFRIEQVANGLQILTLPKYAGVMELLHKTRSAGKLTPAAMETLAIIAYKQPILRVQIEAIRGVASGEMVRSLMERRLVKITGRSEEIGRPMLYGTTKTFLETFGLSSLKDLPKAEDFASGKGL